MTNLSNPSLAYLNTRNQTLHRLGSGIWDNVWFSRDCVHSKIENFSNIDKIWNEMMRFDFLLKATWQCSFCLTKKYITIRNVVSLNYFPFEKKIYIVAYVDLLGN